MVIDETLVRELLDRPDDDAALVLVEGTAQVADRAALEDGGGGGLRGAAVLVTRGELVEQLGGDSASPAELTQAAASLSDSIGKLGA